MTRRHDDHDRSEAPTERVELDKPLPQHAETDEERELLAKMEAAKQRGDAQAFSDARELWLAALRRRTALGEAT